jgi:hypothetical protein
MIRDLEYILIFLIACVQSIYYNPFLNLTSILNLFSYFFKNKLNILMHCSLISIFLKILFTILISKPILIYEIYNKFGSIR